MPILKEEGELGLIAVVRIEDAFAFRTELKRCSLIDKTRSVKRLDSKFLGIPVCEAFINKTNVNLTSVSHCQGPTPTLPGNISTSVSLEGDKHAVSGSVSIEIPDDTTSPISPESSNGLSFFCGIPFSLKRLALSTRKTGGHHCTTVERLEDKIKEFMFERGVPWCEELVSDLPKRWEVHGNLLMLSARDCFTRDIWKQFGRDLWLVVAPVFLCSRVALKGSILNSDYRSPSVELVLGDDAWVEHTDNKVKYTYNVTRCMFSAGNITEKLRVSRFNCVGETVVDLYAGIGYFTLPYLVHAGATHVYACEWNPDAVEALEKGLRLNGVQDRCTVLHGDNRLTCPRNVADRVNLGLIPSSEPGWPVACAALRKDRGGVLHVHMNVTRAKNQYSVGPFSDDNNVIANNVEVGNDTQCKEDTGKNNIGADRDANGTGNDIDRNRERTEIISSKIAKEDVNTLDRYTEQKIGEMVDVRDDAMASKHSPPGAVMLSSGRGRVREEWKLFAEEARGRIEEILEGEYSTRWNVRVIHVERVKSYGPCIDHIVVDIECKPLARQL